MIPHLTCTITVIRHSFFVIAESARLEIESAHIEEKKKKKKGK